MTTTATGVSRPDTDGAGEPVDLVACARQLAPLLREHAAANEAAQQLTQPVVDVLHDQHFFGMWVPKTLGGMELDPVSSLRVFQALAEADPSVAWVTMAGALATGTGGAYLGDEAVAQMFQGPRFPVVAGQGTRPGTAVRDGDGYRLSGSWSFASGIKHAQWIHTLGIVEETGQGLIFVLPVEKAKLIDNWDVMGLRATGSIDYTIDDVFVPAAFTHVGATETSPRGGSLYTLGIMHLAIIAHSAWALGVSRRMLDDLGELVRSKAGRPGTVADSTNFLAAYGEAEARWHAASSFVYETWRGISETLDAGRTLSHEQKTLARLAMYHTTWSAEEISAMVYRAAGTTALRKGPLQQYYRDMHAGTQHMTSGPAAVEACGRALSGLAPGEDWFYMSLVPAQS